jgi:hypothetical protein
LGQSTGNHIVNNTAYQDSIDLINDRTGSGNTWTGNHCGTSLPGWLCQ